MICIAFMPKRSNSETKKRKNRNYQKLLQKLRSSGIIAKQMPLKLSVPTRAPALALRRLGNIQFFHIFCSPFCTSSFEIFQILLFYCFTLVQKVAESASSSIALSSVHEITWKSQINILLHLQIIIIRLCRNLLTKFKIPSSRGIHHSSNYILFRVLSKGFQRILFNITFLTSFMNTFRNLHRIKCGLYDFDVWPIVYLLSTSQLVMHKKSSIVTYDFDFLSISWK